VICFKLLCGRLPYAGKTSAEVLRQVSKGEIVWERLPKYTSPALLDMLYGLLIHGRGIRYGSDKAEWLHEHPFLDGISMRKVFDQPTRLADPEGGHIRGPVMPSECFEDAHSARLRIRMARGLVADIRGMLARRVQRGKFELRVGGQEAATREAALPWLSHVIRREEDARCEAEEDAMLAQAREQAEAQARVEYMAMSGSFGSQGQGQG